MALATTKRNYHQVAADIFEAEICANAKESRSLSSSGDLSLRRSSSCALRLSPLCLTESVSSDLELFEKTICDQTYYNITRTCYPVRERLTCPAGMSAVLNLLATNIGVALHNPTLSDPYVAHELFLGGPVFCGLSSTLRYFCQTQNKNVTIIQYSAFHKTVEETSIEFWLKMYQLAQHYKPCIVAVNRISGRAPAGHAHNILVSMRAALDRNAGFISGVWTVFIDLTHPSSINPSWAIKPDHTAVFMYPSREERSKALTEAIHTELFKKLSDGECQTLLASYAPLIEKCTKPLDDGSEELELGGNYAINEFVKLLFAESLKRQPHLACTTIHFANPTETFPNAEDFKIAQQKALRRKLQSVGVRMGAEISRRQMPAHRAEDSAMYISPVGEHL